MEGLPSDIAHDIFGGVVKGVLENVISELVSQGLITYEAVCEKLQKFLYCDVDKPNKPTTPSSGNFQLKQTESQMWCLVRLLPLVIGSEIPEGNEVWNVIPNLLDMIEYICAPSFDQATVIYMKSIVEDFWQYYLQVFPDEKLKPKGYYTLHYASETKYFGPLVHCWTMRFEGKHNFFKQASFRTKNRINLCKSLAVRHQYHKSNFHCDTFFLSAKQLEPLKGQILPIQIVATEWRESLTALIGNDTDVYFAEKVVVDGQKYSSDSCVVDSCTNDSYSFCKIEGAFIVSGCVYLACTQLEVDAFSKHYHAYIVSFSTSHPLLKISSLLDYHPLGLYEVNNQLFIALKYWIPFDSNTSD